MAEGLSAMTPDGCRALARKYSTQAKRAEDEQRRKALSEMAAHWTNAAAMLERTFALLRDYDACIAAAKSSLDGNGTVQGRFEPMRDAAEL
jgi:hypothetical protein